MRVVQPHDDQIEGYLTSCSNQGRWGASDDRGTLNYITESTVLNATRLVREGVSLSLARELPGESPVPGHGAVHRMLLTKYQGAVHDFVGISSHGLDVTHIDTHGHKFHDGQHYNGRTSAEIVQPDGLTWGDLTPLRDGIVTRGVLLDVAASQEKAFLSDDDWIFVDDLEEAERRGGVEVGRGDAVIIRSGRGAHEAIVGTHQRESYPGLHAEVIPWLHEREVAVYSGDCVEKLPYPSQRFTTPLHIVGIARMGMCVIDNLDCEELASTCASLDRYGFLFVVAPVIYRGASGMAVNPLAVF